MTDGWERQPGGLLLKVDHYDKNNPAHKVAAAGALRNTIQTVSRTHGAKYSERGIYDNMRLLNEADDNDPDLLLELYFAKWDVCERSHANKQQREICLGASIGWFTYHFDDKGNLHRALYEEDTAHDRGQARELIKLKPGDMSLPKEESVAGCLHRIKTRKRHIKDGVDYILGEVAAGNTAMMSQLNKNGALMGEALDSAVLEYHQMPSGLLDSFPEDVKVRPIKWNGVKSKRSFVVRWKQGEHDVRFIVTKGRATAAGVPRIDIHPWDNGNPPEPYTLECVVAATLRAIEEEVGEKGRKWGNLKRPYCPSPLIPLFEVRPDLKAFFRDNGNRIIYNGGEINNQFGAPTPSIHIHIIGKPYMIEAFKDAQARFFGGKPMVPGVNDCRTKNEIRLIA